jgi:exodeoxyribonuclease-3
LKASKVKPLPLEGNPAMRKLWILCAFLSVFFSASIHAQDKVRFLTYNLQEGLHHFEREDTFVNWAKEKKPDIAFLQELNTYSPKRLSEMAARYGHPYSTIVIADFFHIGITSRWPITDIRAVTNPLTHGMIIAK